MRLERQSKEYTIVVLGAEKVGKSSIIANFMNGQISETYQATVEDCHQKLVKFPNNKYQTVNIIDTSGTHEFPAMRDLRITTATVLVIVYDVTDAATADAALDLKKQALKLRGYDGIPVMIVGNKREKGMNVDQIKMPPHQLTEDSACQLKFCDCLSPDDSRKIMEEAIDQCYQASTWEVDIWHKSKLGLHHADKEHKKMKATKKLANLLLHRRG